MPSSMSAYGPIDGCVPSCRDDVIHSQSTGFAIHIASPPTAMSAIMPAFHSFTYITVSDTVLYPKWRPRAA